MEQPIESLPDPKIEAILNFAPVPRKPVRADGWTPQRQRDFIAALAATGRRDMAAASVGLAWRGAYQLRMAPGAAEFCDAWDKALALHHARNLPPPLPPARRGKEAFATAEGDAPETDEDREARDRRKLETFGCIIDQYQLKLIVERRARLEGRIVEADFCVRQLTHIELLLDLGSQGLAVHDVLETFRGLTPEDMSTLDATATPVSLALGELRRQIWREKGEPDRMPPPPLGEHDGRIARGEPLAYRPERDGSLKKWEADRERQRRLGEEAQRLWEEKARAEAEEWGAREGF